MILRCVLDGLILPAALAHGERNQDRHSLWAFDGDEGFALEALEAVYYEVVAATPDELVGLEQAGYRLLRRGSDFRLMNGRCKKGHNPG